MQIHFIEWTCCILIQIWLKVVPKHPISIEPPLVQIMGLVLVWHQAIKAPVTHSLQPVGDLLATKISGGCREVAGWLQGGRRPVANRLQTVAGTIWSQGGFGCCKWNLSATKSIVERFLVVADGLPTGRRLVGDWSPTSCSGCRQSRHSF